jgi:hypothetical protein
MGTEMLATVVEVEELWQTVAAAFIAGVGITFVFSLAVLGAARFTEASRDGRPLLATLFATLAVAGLIATVAVITIGVIVMTSG